MERLGWRFTVSTCEGLAFFGLETHANSLRLNIALELAKHNPVYEDIASKFFEASCRVSMTVQFLMVQ